MMINLDSLTHEFKEQLAEDCEDYLLHRHIPLHSHSYDNIIRQAFKEGYQVDRFDRFVNKPYAKVSAASDQNVALNELREMFDAL